MKAEDKLQGIGLNPSQSKAYVKLLDLGEATAGKIAKETGMAKSHTYRTVEQLEEKGWIRKVQSGKIIYYYAIKPENLINMLRTKELEKEEKIKEIIPILNERSPPETEELRSFKGAGALRDILERFLDYKEPILVYGVPSSTPQKLGYGWLSKYHKKRERKKRVMKHIYSSEARERIKYLNKLPYTEVKVLKGFVSAVATNICGDEISLTDFSATPIKTILIKSKIMANNYKKFFEELWKKAK